MTWIVNYILVMDGTGEHRMYTKFFRDRQLALDSFKQLYGRDDVPFITMAEKAAWHCKDEWLGKNKFKSSEGGRRGRKMRSMQQLYAKPITPEEAFPLGKSIFDEESIRKRLEELITDKYKYLLLIC